MKLKDSSVGLFSAALLAATLVCTPAIAKTGPDPAFAALQNAETQSLSAQEMQAIAGELNAYDIAASLLARAAAATNPRIAAYLTRLANYTLTNAVLVNARLDKYGLLTPCTSTLCP